jgi:hypothetical protein
MYYVSDMCICSVLAIMYYDSSSVIEQEFTSVIEKEFIVIAILYFTCSALSSSFLLIATEPALKPGDKFMQVLF